MAKQILVPLKRDERVEDVIPYIERIVQPGMKVKFLLRYPLDGFDLALRASRAAGETGVGDLTEIRKIAAAYTWENQQRAAAVKVFPACAPLQKKGAEVCVDVYTGSLRRIVRSHVSSGDVHLVVTWAGIGPGIMSFLRGAASKFGLAKRTAYSPMRLVYPSTVL